MAKPCSREGSNMKKTYIMKTVCASFDGCIAWGLAGCRAMAMLRRHRRCGGTVNGVKSPKTPSHYIQGVREQLGADDEDSWDTWLSQNDYTPCFRA